MKQLLIAYLFFYCGQCLGQAPLPTFESLLQAFPEAKLPLELNFHSLDQASLYIQKTKTSPLADKFYPLLNLVGYNSDIIQVYPITKFKRNSKIQALLYATKILSSEDIPEWRFFLASFSRKGEPIAQELVAGAIQNEDICFIKQFKINASYYYNTTDSTVAYYNNFGIPTSLVSTRNTSLFLTDTGSNLIQTTLFKGIEEHSIDFETEQYPNPERWRDCNSSGKKWTDSKGTFTLMINRCGIHGTKATENKWHLHAFNPQNKQFALLKTAQIGDSLCAQDMLAHWFETQVVDLDANQQAEIFWSNELTCANKDRKNYIILEINLLCFDTLYQLRGEVFPKDKKANLLNPTELLNIPKPFFNYMQAAWKYYLSTYQIH